MACNISLHLLLEDFSYDGFEIGSFNPDTVRLKSGRIDFYSLSNGGQGAFNATGPFQVATINEQFVRILFEGQGSNLCTRVFFNVPRPGDETAGAWLAVDSYISY